MKHMPKITMKNVFRLPQTRMHIVLIKTFKDLCTLKESIPLLIAISIVPLLIAYVNPEFGGAHLRSLPLVMQVLYLRDWLFFLTFLWIAGIPLAMYIATIAAGAIAGEINKGTLLQLISKPLRRWEIALGKFLGYILYIMLIELVALILSIYILVTVMGCHLSVFWSLLAYLPTLLLYVLFVTFVFGAIALALSIITAKPSNIILIMVGLVMFIYFGFFMIRMGFTEYYEDYYLYHIDLGYHLGNIFTSIITLTAAKPSITYQMLMSMFAGTYDLSAMTELFDADQGVMAGSLPLSGYYIQIHSFIIWTLIPIALIIIALIQFNRKDIS